MENKEAHTELGVIEDVDASVPRYISQRWGRWFYVVGGVLVFAGLVGLVFGMVQAVMAPVFWFSIGLMIARGKVQAEFFKQFAAHNSFSYEERGSLASVEGDLFERGRARVMTFVVSGTHEKLPIRFFIYQYTEGQGKSSTTHAFTVSEVTFGGTLPDIIVDSKDDMYIDGGFFGKFKTLKLGNDFDNYFTLKVPEDLEIEALEVFTPEIMEQVMKQGRGYSFEFIGTRLYVWKPGVSNKSSELRDILSLAQYLIAALGPRLARLSDDVEAYRSAKA